MSKFEKIISIVNSASSLILVGVIGILIVANNGGGRPVNFPDKPSHDPMHQQYEMGQGNQQRIMNQSETRQEVRDGSQLRLRDPESSGYPHNYKCLENGFTDCPYPTVLPPTSFQ